jgi:hypothetical protein
MGAEVQIEGIVQWPKAKATASWYIALGLDRQVEFEKFDFDGDQNWRRLCPIADERGRARTATGKLAAGGWPGVWMVGIAAQDLGECWQLRSRCRGIS